MDKKELKILIVHNYYRQKGGEDVVFTSESRLLSQQNHEVIEFTDHNKRISKSSRILLALQTIWSWESYKKLLDLLNQEKPDIVHFHNTFPLISPSAYYACREVNVPVIQTIHNYRLMCPDAYLYRQGHVCEECLGKRIQWPGVKHGCYHDSRIETTVIAGTNGIHKALGTWQNMVDIYIALAQFARKKLIAGGLPAEKITIKPNFVFSDPGKRNNHSDFVLFVGRLVQGKGVSTLIKAWELVGNIPLKVIGDGPLSENVAQFADRNHNIEYLKHKEHDEVLELMKNARFLIFPSEWYEVFGLTIIEAFSCELPVIASMLGSAVETIRDGYTGLHFIPGDPNDLATKVRWAWEHPSEMSQMGKNARREYEEKYTAEKNYKMLMDIYLRAIQLRRNAG